jgi:hypothetical protein
MNRPSVSKKKRYILGVLFGGNSVYHFLYPAIHSGYFMQHVCIAHTLSCDTNASVPLHISLPSCHSLSVTHRAVKSATYTFYNVRITLRRVRASIIAVEKENKSKVHPRTDHAGPQGG